MSFEKEEGDLDILLRLLEENDESSSVSPQGNGLSPLHHEERIESLQYAVAKDIISKKNEFHPNGSAIQPPSCSKDQTAEAGNASSQIDPLEKELRLMEENMQKLREAISKKKALKSNDDKPFRFTKLSAVIIPGCSKSESNERYLSGNERERLLRDLDNSKSEIHSGDTDSEDDEDNRAPLEAQLSTYGREMKKRISHCGQELRKNLIASKNQNLNSWKKAKGGALLPMNQKVLHKSNIDDSPNSAVDPFSGIRIINPLVSMNTMKELMGERKMIQLSAILSHIRGGEIEGDWVTIGVLVSKSETKTSQKGNQYSIWQMSDLKDCTKVVSLFLFTGAYKGLWKTTVGSVVGILNPQIMKESNKPDDGRNSLTLSVNNHEKILLMGVSKDLGWCKGRNKQGSNCRQFVNKNVCEFCIFHIQREYQKMSSKRAEIQSSFARVDPRNRFQKRVLGKNQVFYGGQLYCSNNEKSVSSSQRTTLNPASRAKDLATLTSLTMKLKAENLKEKEGSFMLKHLPDEHLDTVKNVLKDNEELGQMLLAPSPGARNLLLHKTKSGHAEGTSKSRVSSRPSHRLTAKGFLALTTSRTDFINPEDTPNKTPLLGRGLGPGKNLEIEVSSKFDPVKAKATAIIKKRGGIQPSEKNMKRNKERATSSAFQTNVQKRMRELLDEGQDGSTNWAKKPKDNCSPPTAIAAFPQKSLLGSVDINSEKFLSMMKAKSTHTSLLQKAEDEEVDKYYNSLEKKEMLENKMASTMEMPCKAVICLQCKYKAMSAADHCREERHSLKVIQATKRFFECRNCKQRAVSLTKLPGKPCSHCSQSSWRRVAMTKERHGPKLESEILSLRGDELSHISSSSNKIFINL